MRSNARVIVSSMMLAIALSVGATSVKSSPIVLDGSQREITIGDRVDVAVDTSAQAVAAAPGLSHLQFARSTQTIPNFTVDPRAIYWMRFDVVDVLTDVNWFLAVGNPTIHRLDVYLFRDGSLVGHYTDGTVVPVEQKALRTRVPVVPLALSSEGRHQIVVRIDGGLLGHYFPLTIINGAALAASAANQTMLYGIYCGFMLFMLCLSLAFAVALREVTYLLYAASMFSNVAIILVIDGIVFQHFFTSDPAPVAVAYVVTVTIMQVMSILFGRAYLKSREATPKLDRALLVILAIVIAMPLTWFIDARTAVSLTSATAATYYLLLLAIAVIQMRRGSRPSIFFLVSWIVYIACAALITLYYRGDYPYFFIYFGMIGSALQAMILSFGLADATSVDRREKRLIQQRALEHQTALATSFSRFVPREILGFLGRAEIEEVALGDVVQRELTVLFSDIRSFTTISERLTPRETFDFLNDYLGVVGPLIREHGGFIDKYVGDAIMAVFAGPTSAAVDAALAMLEKLREYNAVRTGDGPPIAIGIGIHTGQAMLGTIGETQRMDGTVISDAVNLASRLQSLTKEHQADLLVSQSVIERLDGARFTWRLVDSVVVRGKTELTDIYEIGVRETTASRAMIA